MILYNFIYLFILIDYVLYYKYMPLLSFIDATYSVYLIQLNVIANKYYKGNKKQRKIINLNTKA